MGAPNVHPYWTPGENAIVQTDKFKGPADLARHINEMCNDDEKYNEYFEWKKKGFSAHFMERFKDCAFYGAECRLCQYLHAEREKVSASQKKDIEARRIRKEYNSK